MQREAIERLYREYLVDGNSIAAHMPTLRDLAYGCRTVVELGCQFGKGATALLLGCTDDGNDGVLHSVDLHATGQARELVARAGGCMIFHECDTRTAPIPPCDMMFVDSFHSFAQVDAELKAHASKVRKYIAFHDTITFGTIAAADDRGNFSMTQNRGQMIPLEKLGVLPAVVDLLMRDPSWQVIRNDKHGHGLIVLERRAS